jgi:hypothetical protein
MDLLYILIGAVMAGYGLILRGGTLGMVIGIVGAVIFVYGLIINHQRHQGRK